MDNKRWHMIFFCMCMHFNFFIYSMETKTEDYTKYYTLTPQQVRKWKQTYEQSSLGRKKLISSTPMHAATIFNQTGPLTAQEATYKLVQVVQQLREKKELSQENLIAAINLLLEAKADPYAVMIVYKGINDTIAHKILEIVVSSGNFALLEKCLEKKVNFKKIVPNTPDTPYGMVLKVSKLSQVKQFKHAPKVIMLIDAHEEVASTQGIGSKIN